MPSSRGEFTKCTALLIGGHLAAHRKNFLYQTILFRFMEFSLLSVFLFLLYKIGPEGPKLEG
jgi:hypothetical protein